MSSKNLFISKQQEVFWYCAINVALNRESSGVIILRYNTTTTTSLANSPTQLTHNQYNGGNFPPAAAELLLPVLIWSL